VAQRAQPNFPQWPIAHEDLEVKFLGEFESIFENALVYESGDQLGTFGEVTLDKKISRYCSFNVIIRNLPISAFASILLHLEPLPLLQIRGRTEENEERIMSIHGRERLESTLAAFT
jgi:hypothetical protein